MRRCVALLLSLVLLAGCTNDRAVDAVVIDGWLAFTASDNPDGGDDCLTSFRVEDKAGNTMWAIAGQRPAQRMACVSAFPLHYGDAPAGLATITRAQPLQPGMVYVVHGTGQGVLRGVFRFTGRGAPIIYASGTDEWCRGQYPATQRANWLGQCVVDIAKKSQ